MSEEMSRLTVYFVHPEDPDNSPQKPKKSFKPFTKLSKSGDILKSILKILALS